METTRTQSQPVQSNTALARQKPGQAPAGNEAAAQGGFLALLAALGTDESVASAAFAGSGGETALATAASDEEPADESEGLGAVPDLMQMGVLVPPAYSLPTGAEGSGLRGDTVSVGLTQCDVAGVANTLVSNEQGTNGFSLANGQGMANVDGQGAINVPNGRGMVNVDGQEMVNFQNGLEMVNVHRQGIANVPLAPPNSLTFDALGMAKAVAQGELGDSLVAQTVQMDAFAVAEGAVAAATVSMPATRFHAALSHRGAAGAWAGAGGFLAAQERALGLGGTQAAAGPAALAGSDGAAATAGASSALWAQLQGAQHGASADLREGGAALAAAVEESVGAVVAAALPARAQDQGQGQSQPQGGMLAAGSEVSAAEGALHPMGEASYEAAMAAAEEALSEQVTYWVNQNMQKAQLTVEHDGGAVSVSVALQGNEAHVSLMADQAQARDLLDADQAQLRELLRQQGLDLAGLTVGLSAQRQGGEPQGQSSGQPADPRGGAAPQDGPERTARVGLRVLTDRAVDLFV